MSVTRIDRYRGSKIVSIFGQIEEVVARAMIEEQKVRLIPLTEFPSEIYSPKIWRNEQGQLAKFAILLSYHAELEFARRVQELYA